MSDTAAAPQKKKQVRNKALDTIGLSIPPARIRKLLDRQGINGDVQSEIVGFKQLVQTYQKGTADKKSPEYKKFQTPEYVESASKWKTFKGLAKQRAELLATKIADGETEKKVANEAAVAKLDAQLLELTNDPLVKLKKQIAVKSQGRYRFNENVCVALGALIQMILCKIMQFSIDKVRGEDKKIINIEHAEGIETLDIYPFIHTLKTITRMRLYIAQLKEYKSEVESIRKLRHKSADEVQKKLYDDQIKNLKNTKKPVMYVTSKGKDKKAEYTEANELYYYTQYVKRGLKEHLKNTASNAGAKDFYESVRFSQGFRHLLSEMMVEFIKRLCPYIKTVLTLMRLKTVNVLVLMSILELQMTDMHGDFAPIQAYLDRKIEQYKTYHVEKEKQKKSEKAAAASDTTPATPAVGLTTAPVSNGQ